jgi:DNA-binding MarR family transcriptional regulator
MFAPNRDLDETDAGRLQRLFTRLSRFMREHNPTGLSMTTTSVFSTIEAHEGATLSELATIEGVAPPTITRVVTELEALRLVVRVTDPVDGRVSRVQLTPRGRQQHAVWRADYLKWFNQQLATLPRGERAALVQSIDALEHLVAGLHGTDSSAP